MAYKTAEVLELIARRPGVRTVEIADLVDIDVDLVRKSIQAEIDQGIVKTEEVKALNGRMTVAHSISPNHIAKYLAPGAAISVSAPASPAPASAVSGPGAILPAAPANLTKVELAINCVRANAGRATSAQLHQAMGLRSSQHPTNFLAAPLNNGRLVRDNGFWCTGSGTKAQAKPASAAASIAPPAPAAKPDLPFAQTESIKQEVKEEAAQATADARFACALWSDCTLQLTRGGVVLAALNAAETQQLLVYLDRNPDRRAA